MEPSIAVFHFLLTYSLDREHLALVDLEEYASEVQKCAKLGSVLFQ